MREIVKSRIARARSEIVTPPPIAKDESGVVLLDKSLSPIAFDQGAAAILDYSDRSCGVKSVSGLPEDILEAIRNRPAAELSSVEIRFQRGERQFVCRAYLVESHSPASAHPFVALLLQSERPDYDPIEEFAAKHGLTKREQKVLGYLSLGLTNNQVAERMKVSPDTVKTALQRIKSRIGVGSRGEILAMLLEYQEPNPRKLPDSAVAVNEGVFEKSGRRG